MFWGDVEWGPDPIQLRNLCFSDGHGGCHFLHCQNGAPALPEARVLSLCEVCSEAFAAARAGTAQCAEGRSQDGWLCGEIVLVSENCVWGKHSSYFQRRHRHSFQREAVQIAKEGKEYLSFPASWLQMSHRAPICVCRRFQSLCTHAHPGSISEHYSTITVVFHHASQV